MTAAPPPATGRTLHAAQETVGIYDRPNLASAAQERELVWGEGFIVEDWQADEDEPSFLWLRGISTKDGYPGWVHGDALGERAQPATHKVITRETLRLPQPGAKNGPSPLWLSFASQVRVIGESGDGRWSQIAGEPGGSADLWVPRDHLAPLSRSATDPVAIARLFLGTAYVWGGNSGRGIDCSGLVQAALLSCGVDCPADSGPQREAFLEPDRAGPYRPGELLFWQGHVAMATGADRMIHANAHHMQVIEEAIGPALDRIERQGDSPYLGRGRAIRPRG